MSAPPYSIVVVTWQCAGYLAGLVRTMNEYLDGTQELVVVDNASEDQPEAAARRWKGPLEFVQTGENLGFGVGSNVGTERARGPAVVLLNPDTELRDDGLDSLAAKALERRALVGPRMLNANGTRQASGPRMRSSRSNIVPPRIIASRASGGKEGDLPALILVWTAPLNSGTCPAKYWEAPSTSHAQRR